MLLCGFKLVFFVCFRFSVMLFGAQGSPSVTEWPPIGKIAAHSDYDMFSWYKYLIANIVFFPTSVFGVGIFF